MSTACAICGHVNGHTEHIATERMLGLGGTFRYRACAGCGCLELVDIPADLGRYYPASYYSFKPEVVVRPGAKERLKRRAMHHLLLHRLGGNDPLGALIALGADKFRWMPRAKAGLQASFLDVGCGSGRLLLMLKGLGMRKLTGADPFIEADIHYPGGLTIHKRDVFTLEGSYDLIHLGHAFEHMAEPLQVLRRLHELLAPGGTAIIRIPVADSYAWRHYGTAWVQLDAPRHLFLHTGASMRRLAEQAGLVLAAEQRDSSVFQFEGSEKYGLGLLLDAPDPFTPAQRKAWARHARALNAEGTGDTATFHLQRPA